ncbi:MAG: rubrerythrin family protein [Candidatus Moranbacteria bacterium]|nr:rubrerythrin family protein [Candidatus Moranbacteria bacterium]
MSKTQEDLKAAFAGESQANRKYLAFAKKAEEEGKPGLAKLFRVAAEGETVHALNHLQASGGIKSTKENLEAAIAGETYEIEKMYPEFLEDAKAEGIKAAEISFQGALKVEGVHQDLFNLALEKLELGEDVSDEEYYICPVCGYPAIGAAPDNCPVCNTPGEKFYTA